jgi:FMN-dependent NADH-azoreductase
MNILQINSSARSGAGNSTRVADAIVARLKNRHPGARVEVRDLARDPHPILDEAALGALFVPADRRTPNRRRGWRWTTP